MGNPHQNEQVLADETFVGRHCIFVDPRAGRHDALITAVWGPQCVNLTFVVDDDNQRDSYGRKLERSYTSVMHASLQQAHGNYWYMP